MGRPAKTTRRRRLLAAFGLATVLAFVPPVAAPGAQASTSPGRTASGAYVGTPHDPFAAAVVLTTTRVWLADVRCAADGRRSVGGACFGLGPAERGLNVTVADDSGRSVSGHVRFSDDAGAELGRRRSFCRSTSVSIPRRAVAAIVAVDSTYPSCPILAAGPATTGHVLLTVR